MLCPPQRPSTATSSSQLEANLHFCGFLPAGPLKVFRVFQLRMFRGISSIRGSIEFRRGGRGGQLLDTANKRVPSFYCCWSHKITGHIYNHPRGERTVGIGNFLISRSVSSRKNLLRLRNNLSSHRRLPSTLPFPHGS